MQIIPANKSGPLGRGEQIKGGCVCLAPGKNVGEHSTGGGEEILLVLEGEATVVAGGERQVLKKDESLFIPKNTLHDVRNASSVNLVYAYFVGGKK